jgi:hypothetical protein
VLKADHSQFIPLAATLRKRFEVGVSLGDAVIYAPFIVAWREYRASESVRGSLSHDSAARRQKTKGQFKNRAV